MIANGLVVSGAVILAAAGIAAGRAGQAEGRSAKDGVYTAVQADRGSIVYDRECLECHGSMTAITPDLAPLLGDYVFQSMWKDRSVGELFERIRDTMPQDAPGTLSPEELADLTAYILSANRLPPGEAALPTDVETLTGIRLDTGQP